MRTAADGQDVHEDHLDQLRPRLAPRMACSPGCDLEFRCWRLRCLRCGRPLRPARFVRRRLRVVERVS